MSAIDHGRKILRQGENHTFANYVNFQCSFPAVQSWVTVWEKWKKCKGTYLLRYEDLVKNTVEKLKSIVTYLNYEVNVDHIDDVLRRYNKSNLDEFKVSYLHFNKGISNRYKQDMTAEHKMIFKEKLGEKLIQMGYTLE